VQSGNYVVLSDFGKEKAGRSALSGRPNCLSEEKLAELLKVYYTKPYSLRKLGDMFGVSRMTVWRLVQQFQLNEVTV
jgi:transposase